MEESSPPLTTTATATAKPNSLLHHLITLDTKCSLHLHQISQPIPRSFLKLLEISGDGRFWLPIPISLFFALSSKSDHLRSLLTGLILGTLLDLILVGLTKFTVRRPRPVYNKGMRLAVAVDHWSFPSGHSSRVCFIGSFLFMSIDSIIAAAMQLGIGGGNNVRLPQQQPQEPCRRRIPDFDTNGSSKNYCRFHSSINFILEVMQIQIEIVVEKISKELKLKP